MKVVKIRNNVYQVFIDDKKVAVIKAKTKEEAIKKAKEFWNGS
jgi:hypothetical protein